MKKYKSPLIYTVIVLLCSLVNTANAGSYTWTGSKDHVWSDAQNWSSSIVPGTNDTVTIVSATNNPQLSASVTVKRITMTSGTLDLNGDTLTITGNSIFNGGTINNGLVMPKGSTTTFAGTTFGAAIQSRCAKNELNGGTYNAVVSFEDTANSNVTSTGGCIFHGAVTIIKSGTGSGYKVHAGSAANTFNSTLAISNAGTREIQMSTAGTNNYYGNVTVTCTGTGGIYFGTAGGGLSKLDTGKTITVGPGGFTAGTLLLRDFLQKGSKAQFIRLTGAGVLNCISASFNGPTVLNAPAMALKSSVFTDSATFVHTGGTRTNSDGGNVFNGVTLLTDSGAGYMRLAVTDSDSFNGNVTFRGLGGRIQIGWGSIAYFSGNITQTGDVSFANGIGITTLTGSNAQTLHSTDSLIRFQNLRINKAANDVTLTHDTRVDSVLNFYKGRIISSSGALMIIDTGATVAGVTDSSYVSGPVKKKGKNAFVFPIGKDAVYRALEMSAPSSATDAFTAEYFNTEQTLGDSLDTTFHYLSQCDYWNFERNGGSSNVTVSLHFKSPTCGILDSANLRIAKWNSTVWNNKGTGTFTGNQTNGKLATPSALTSYGYLCLLYRLPPITFITTVTPLVFSMSRDMQPDFNGYNGTNTITIDQTWDDLSANLPNVRSLYPHNLRYPGGTVANYWNWGEGNFLEEYQFTSGIAGLKLTDRFKTLNSDLNAKQNILSNFKKSVDVTGSAPIFNLNIFSSDYPYQKAMLFHAKELSLPVKYIELGNEFYNDFEEHRLVFPSVKDYATKAADWARELKLATWNANSSIQPEIAVVGSWQSPQSDSRQRVWLDNLLPEIDGNTDIDAVTIHQYLGSGFAKITDLNAGIDEGSCLEAVYTYNSTYAMIPFQSAFNNIDWLKANDFKKIGDAGKKIWITEFNMGDHTFTTYGSWTQALMVSAMLLGYLEDENVTKVCPHELVGNGIFGAMFNGNTDNLEYSNDADGVQDDPVGSDCDNPNGNTYETQEWGKSASGAAVALISHAIEESTYAEQIDFSGFGLATIGITPDRPVLYGWKFTKPYSIEYIIINMGGDNYAIDPQHIIAAGSGNGYWEYLRAANTDYITGDPGSGTKHLPSYVGRIAFNPATTFPVTGYSITRVVVPNATACTMMLVATEDHICEGSTTTISLEGIFPNQGSLIAWSSPPELNRVFWEGSALVSPGTGSAGTYTVSVTDGVCTATVSITVDEPPTLTAALTGGSSSICPPSETAILTATCNTCTDLIWTPSYALSSPTVAMSSTSPFTITVSPEQTTEYIVYGTDGVCWTSATALPITSYKPVIESITEPLVKCDDANPFSLDVVVDLNFTPNVSYLWSTAATTSTATGLTGGTYTVTVTNTDNTCTSSATTSVKVISHCCVPNTTNGDILVYGLGDPQAISRRADLAFAINNTTPKDYTFTSGVVTHTGTNSGVILINGYFEVDNDITFTGCTIQFGEQAEVHVDKAKTLRFTGCTISACSAWTWRSIYVGEGATIILEDDAGNVVPTQIADADTALNLSYGADYNVVNSTFSNNYTGMHLYEYRRAVNPNGIGNITGNDFSTSSLKTSPVGSYAYGLSGISLLHTEDVPIGDAGASNINTFSNLYTGILSVNSNATIINNDFADIQAESWQAAGSGVYAFSDLDYYDRTVSLGAVGSNTKGNYFNNCINGIFAVGDLNLNIFNNRDYSGGTISGGFKNIDNYSIGILYNPTGSINIANNLVENVHTGIGIKIENATQTDNVVNIYDNEITDLQTGIDIKKVNGVKIYKVSTGNTITFHLGSSTLTSNFYGISLDHCDDVFVHENTIDNGGNTNSSTNLRGLNVVDCETANICSNTISETGYSMYFEGNCASSAKLKLNHMEKYEAAIYFYNSYFSEQGINNSQTWENVFDDNLTTKKRLDGSLLSSPFNWYYNSANSNMDISNTTPPNYYQYNGIPTKINSIGISGYGISDCDPLPERMKNIAEESDSYLEFHLYPNPSNDYFIVEQISSSETFEVIIFDVTGRKLISKSSNTGSAKIDISKLPTGLYNVVINQEQQLIASKKIIVQH